MVGALAGGEGVGVVGVEGKAGAAVLQHEAAVLGDDARAEAAIEAVDQRAAVALGVGGGQVYGIAALPGGRAVHHRFDALVAAEQLSPLGEVFLLGRVSLCWAGRGWAGRGWAGLRQEGGGRRALWTATCRRARE